MVVGVSIGDIVIGGLGDIVQDNTYIELTFFIKNDFSTDIIINDEYNLCCNFGNYELNTKIYEDITLNNNIEENILGEIKLELKTFKIY